MNKQKFNNFLKDPRTNRKYILIVVILAFLVGGGIFGYQWLVKKEEFKVSEVPKEEEVKFPVEKLPEEVAKNEIAQKIFSIITDINFVEGEYRIDGAKFELWCDYDGGRSNERCPEKEGEIYKEYFVASNKGQEVYESLRVYQSPWSCTICKLFTFDYKNNKYIILTDWSGGNKCCANWYIFRLDKNNDLKFIKLFGDLGTAIAHPTEESLKEKNGKLYLVMQDERFSPFYMTGYYYYVRVIFPQYYLIEKDDLLRRNADFKEEYTREATDADNKLQNLISEKIKMGKKIDFLDGFPLLLDKVVNYILAGENEKAWQDFEDIFAKFSLLSPSETGGEKADPKIIKEMIIEKMESGPH